LGAQGTRYEIPWLHMAGDRSSVEDDGLLLALRWRHSPLSFRVSADGLPVASADMDNEDVELVFTTAEDPDGG